MAIPCSWRSTSRTRPRTVEALQRASTVIRPLVDSVKSAADEPEPGVADPAVTAADLRFILPFSVGVGSNDARGAKRRTPCRPRAAWRRSRHGSSELPGFPELPPQTLWHVAGRAPRRSAEREASFQG